MIGERRAGRLGLFGALYFAQGVPYGFVTVALPIYLASRIEQAAISTLVATVLLPWSVKWLAGPVIDRFTVRRFGRRRPWILLAQAGMAASMAALVAVDPVATRGAFIATLLVHNVFAALQDVAVDAWAVDVVPAGERGAAQSVMFGAKYAGIALGGAPLSWLVRHHGFGAVALVQAAMLVAVGGLVLAARDGERGGDGGDAPVFRWRELARAFLAVGPALGVIYAFIDRIGTNMVGSVFLPHLTDDLGHAAADAERLSAWMVLGTALGCLAGGTVSDRLGRRRTIAAATVLTAGFYAALFALPALRTDLAALTGFAVAMAFAEGFLITAQTSLFMDLTSPAVGATQFTAYMSFNNVCGAWSIAAAGALAGAFDRAAVLAFAAAGQLFSLLLLRWLPGRSTEGHRPG
ncbi:MAG TPA: MFS transporter [Kofleriaceae bacterium]|nr:MFS transporter [Kofleriaceae bacterium]